ncbi:hypothetical protein HU200_034512 [Digitaria exilis]|uniref:Plastid lipid-associated protein/fibrillin conserved domain-containing protein n=1 Tax=Digitaria exilis TaxID=1010633 RepID=A0A835ENR3_9POAL|nr:hypothetical protein HU200_034512 [Digitaria exilis]
MPKNAPTSKHDVNERTITLPPRTRPEQRHSPRRLPTTKISSTHDAPYYPIRKKKAHDFWLSPSSSRNAMETSRVLNVVTSLPSPSSSRGFPRSDPKVRNAKHHRVTRSLCCCSARTTFPSVRLSLHGHGRAVVLAAFLPPGRRIHQRAAPACSSEEPPRRALVRGSNRPLLSVRATAAAPPPPLDYSGDNATTDADYVASLKVKLLVSPLLEHPQIHHPLFVFSLSAVSGLNRGLAASEEDLSRADAAARELEAAAGGEPVDLERDLDKLQGRWRLVYSSAFSRPGPPTGRLLPITLGQVFQRIDVVSRDFDNIVELELGAPWPLPPLEVTATLAHKFEIVGTSGVKINFEKTTVKTKGSLSQLPPLEVPRIPDNLRPPSNTGSGEFEVTYLDGDTRITRGDRGELRVFVIA